MRGTWLTVIIVAAVIGGLIWALSQLQIGLRHAAVVNTGNWLRLAHQEFRETGVMTNRWTDSINIHAHTNEYRVGETNYLCILAATDWDTQGRRNLLVYTTNGVLLFIGDEGVTPLIGTHRLPRQSQCFGWLTTPLR